ncbi:sensor domain-containing diguanylate cyclase [Clostridium swellfunianum]|uniref:sensor domain-containing diguanylate cyclase n=1 Tax=Clostridium swellfunianum TaxID=1367462 RepID=UPI00202F17D8|nr:sensor domain-containing diguanylate cyclase [Clostridium swellfunianum]MCM0649491.1 sensor domain-containing diguanylate cyclase [Clostridium swellfunianum]
MGEINLFTALIMALIAGVAIMEYFKIKKINRKLLLLEKVRRTLYEVAEKIIRINSEEEAYTLVLETAIELIPHASKGSILLLDEDCQFHYKTLKGYSEELKKISLKKEEIYLYKINNFTETAIIKDPNRFDEDVIRPDKVHKMNTLEVLDISCTMSSPIFIEDNLIGIINVDSIIKGKFFTDEDLALMNYINNELQLALKNSFVQNKLKYMANYDELTGLYNRRYFKQFLSKELSQAKRYKTQCCLALIDLDDFKLINDNYGHNMGDKALKLFANVLRKNLRKTDIFARMSGDEFVILFINCSKQDATQRLEDIRKELSKQRLENIVLSFSYGVSEINSEIDLSQDDIFGTADKEMYCDKHEKNMRKKAI